MVKIYLKICDLLEIGDNLPTVLMGVLNLSPESFYRGSVYDNLPHLEKAALEMITNGAKILDLGARSTAPWSQKISIEEEIKRIIPAMEKVCKIITDDIIISVDTQYRDVAQKALEIADAHRKQIIINDVSCLKTDPSLADFIIEKNLPIILMASKEIPGDLCTIDEIIEELKKTIEKLVNKGYNEKFIIIDPGIGKWIPEKTYEYDLKIIGQLEKLRVLKKPILVALSRKSFIGTTLNKPDPAHRLNGTLSATAISIFNGAHIIRTHDINAQLNEMMKMAEEIRRNR